MNHNSTIPTALYSQPIPTALALTTPQEMTPSPFTSNTLVLFCFDMEWNHHKIDNNYHSLLKAQPCLGLFVLDSYFLRSQLAQSLPRDHETLWSKS